ncbi:hypothetical protein [Rhodococcus koreensis]|uniref:hypothetical protein n=1 Tax=Rhodococcus koreensis TaxID=99653 RepID=UPI0036D7F08A
MAQSFFALAFNAASAAAVRPSKLTDRLDLDVAGQDEACSTVASGVPYVRAGRMSNSSTASANSAPHDPQHDQPCRVAPEHQQQNIDTNDAAPKTNSQMIGLKFHKSCPAKAKVSLVAAKDKLAQVDARSRNTATDLGTPSVPTGS